MDSCIILPRNEVGAKLCFYRCCVITVHRGSTWPGTPPWYQVHHPRTEVQPIPQTRYSPGPGDPLGPGLTPPVDQVTTPQYQVHPWDQLYYPPEYKVLYPWDHLYYPPPGTSCITPQLTRISPFHGPGYYPPGQLDKFVELDEEAWKMSIIFDVKLISSKLGLYWSVLIVKPWDGLFVLQGRPESSPLPRPPPPRPYANDFILLRNVGKSSCSLNRE